MNLITPLLLALLLPAVDEVKGELYVSSDGEKIIVDLSALPSVIGKPLASPSEFTVHHGEREIKRADADAKMVSIPGVVGRTEDPETITITHKDFKIVLTVRPGENKRIEAGRSGNSVWITIWSEGGDEWKTKSHDEGFVVYADSFLRSVDGVDVSGLKPLVKGTDSAFYLTPADYFQEWRFMAEKCYQAVLEKKYDDFVQTFNEFDKKQADKRRQCQMYWSALRKTVDNNNVVKFNYQSINKYKNKPELKKLMFKRLDGDDKQVGYDTAIIVKLEEGKWVILMVSP